MSPPRTRAAPCPYARQRRCMTCGRRADANDLAARISAFRPEIDQPVRRSDDVEIVLDDQQRMARRDQAPERTQQFCDVVEVQARRRLVEQEQLASVARANCACHRAARDDRPASGAAPRRPTASAPVGPAADSRGRLPPAARSVASTSRSPAKNSTASATRHVEHVRDAAARAVARFNVTSRISPR